MRNSKLKYYLEHGYLNKFGGLLAISFPSFISLISSKFISIKDLKPFQEAQNKITVSLEPYSENLKKLHGLVETIHNSKSKSVYAAIVHGSIDDPTPFVNMNLPRPTQLRSKQYSYRVRGSS